MAKKRKTLPDNLQEIIDSKDMAQFKTIFEKCEINATRRGKTTANIFSYRNLTVDHLSFLIENGIDVNNDAGWSQTPVTFLSDQIELLTYMIDHGADIEHSIDQIHGNALFINAWTHHPQAVENLLSCGADPQPCGGWRNHTALDEALMVCRGIDLIKMVRIAKALLSYGAVPSEKTYDNVRRIGEDFEFRRADFNPEIVDAYSHALDELYSLFNVTPVPRRILYDGKTPIEVHSKTWQKQYDELWKLLVPGNGHASTIQGEVIRIIGKITYELIDQGGINWDTEYRNMVQALPAYFQTFDGQTSNKACLLSTRITAKSDEHLLYELAETAVQWVLEHNHPVKLETVNYKR